MASPLPPSCLSTIDQQEQDLGRKCSAWKGFIPRLQWKYSSPKQILCPKINYGSEEILGPQKNLVLKTFGPKKLWIQKNFGLKQILGPKIFCWKKNFGLKKDFGSEKKIGYEINFESEKNFQSKSFGFEIGSNDIAGLKILGPKKFLM